MASYKDCNKGKDCCGGEICTTYAGPIHPFNTRSFRIEEEIIIHQYGEGVGGICRDTHRKKLGRFLQKHIKKIERAKIGKTVESRFTI